MSDLAKEVFDFACTLNRVQAYSLTGDPKYLEKPMQADADVAHDEAVQAEVDREFSDEAAAAMYRAIKITLARGKLEAITEHMLLDALAKADAL